MAEKVVVDTSVVVRVLEEGGEELLLELARRVHLLRHALRVPLGLPLPGERLPRGEGGC